MSSQSIIDQQLMNLKRSSEAVRDRDRLAEQLAQDFERLDLLNKESIAPLSAAPSPDYKSLLDLTAEIKGRATRIKYNIPLPLKNRKREEIRYEANGEQLGSLLPELGRLLASFTGNPVFHLSSPDDSELRSRAGRDLDRIIKLSETIHKLANRLSKSAVSVK